MSDSNQHAHNCTLTLNQINVDILKSIIYTFICRNVFFENDLWGIFNK